MSSTPDVLIIGGGIIGVSLALELRHRGTSVRVLERGEPGREASYAGAGMLSASDPDTPTALRALATASAEMYPQWAAELEAESEEKVDFRTEGTIYLWDEAKCVTGRKLSADEIAKLEPGLALGGKQASLLEEASVDPRGLMAALIVAAKKAGVVVSHEHEVSGIEIGVGKAAGVRVGNEVLHADVVINCAGAWAAGIEGAKVPTHPVKGQMLSVVSPHHSEQMLRHIVRSEDVYLVPRSDGRILIGATVEDAGFDKRVDSDVILRLRDLGAALVPKIAEMSIHESWTGLRPGSPDKLPIMGETTMKGYFAATGHYRNGILLAPITAKTVAKLVFEEYAGLDLSRFDAKRFA